MPNRFLNLGPIFFERRGAKMYVESGDLRKGDESFEIATWSKAEVRALHQFLGEFLTAVDR